MTPRQNVKGFSRALMSLMFNFNRCGELKNRAPLGAFLEACLLRSKKGLNERLATSGPRITFSTSPSTKFLAMKILQSLKHYNRISIGPYTIPGNKRNAFHPRLQVCCSQLHAQRCARTDHQTHRPIRRHPEEVTCETIVQFAHNTGIA